MYHGYKFLYSWLVVDLPLFSSRHQQFGIIVNIMPWKWPISIILFPLVVIDRLRDFTLDKGQGSLQHKPVDMWSESLRRNPGQTAKLEHHSATRKVDEPILMHNNTSIKLCKSAICKFYQPLQITIETYSICCRWKWNRKIIWRSNTALID
jgi:hypothetical protein